MNEAKTNLTLKQRQRMQGKAPSEQKPGKQGGSKEVPMIVAILLLLLALGGGTALGMYYFRPDPRLQEMDDMMAIANDPFTPEDMRGMLRGETGEIAAELPANLRRGRGMNRDPEEWDMARAPKFLALSPADQLKKLNEEIERQRERESEVGEKREAEAAANGTAKPADSSQANDNSKSGSGSSGGRGGRSDQQRVQRQEQGLANHPPQQRAQGGLMRQMRNAVREQASAK